MIAWPTAISASVFDTWGDGFSVQPMNTALRSEKSYGWLTGPPDGPRGLPDEARRCHGGPWAR